MEPEPKPDPEPEPVLPQPDLPSPDTKPPGPAPISSSNLSTPSQVVETSNDILNDVASAPSERSTCEKRKREGRKTSKVWAHFTKLPKKPDQREECQCNHCGHLYACSSRHGTSSLKKHIFRGGCSKYKPLPSELEGSTNHLLGNLNDVVDVAPLRESRPASINDREQVIYAHMKAEITQLKDENVRLQQERDSIADQKASLEQLIVTMAAETARLSEEIHKLRSANERLQEEKQKVVTREEFVNLEAQVSKLREEFERDRRGFPTAAVAALAQLQKNR